MLLKFRDKYPQIDKAAFVADNATIIGDVTLEEDATVWFGAVLRGDSSSIKIGKGSNIQDNCTLHCDEGSPLSIGQNVTMFLHCYSTTLLSFTWMSAVCSTYSIS